MIHFQVLQQMKSFDKVCLKFQLPQCPKARSSYSLHCGRCHCGTESFFFFFIVRGGATCTRLLPSIASPPSCVCSFLWFWCYLIVLILVEIKLSWTVSYATVILSGIIFIRRLLRELKFVISYPIKIDSFVCDSKYRNDVVISHIGIEMPNWGIVLKITRTRQWL